MFVLHQRLDLRLGVVVGGDDQVFEDLDIVFLEQRRIDLQALHLDLAGQRDGDHAATGQAFDFELGDFLLHGSILACISLTLPIMPMMSRIIVLLYPFFDPGSSGIIAIAGHRQVVTCLATPLLVDHVRRMACHNANIGDACARKRRHDRGDIGIVARIAESARAHLADFSVSSTVWRALHRADR